MSSFPALLTPDFHLFVLGIDHFLFHFLARVKPFAFASCGWALSWDYKMSRFDLWQTQVESQIMFFNCFGSAVGR
jgi:hypothetical protein